jgi:uncharacterized protein (DUF3820 family)
VQYDGACRTDLQIVIPFRSRGMVESLKMNPEAADHDQHQILMDLANMKMPFGRYAGRYLIDLPEPYVLWFRKKGFPAGRLGVLLESLVEIKANGLEPLVRRIRTGP